MIILILLLIFTAGTWLITMLDEKNPPNCDHCLGDDCPFPDLPCERRSNAIK